MGSGFIFLLLACAAGYFLFRRSAFLGAAQARFERRSEPGGVVFEVTPARPSVTFALFRAAVSAIFFVVLISFLGAGVIGWVIWLGATYILFRPLLHSQRHRKPARLTVSPQALSTDSRSYAVQDIVELQVRCGVNAQAAPVKTANVHTVAGVPVAGTTSISADVSRALHNRLAARSYVLTLRTSNGSTEDVISGGLTQECAEALMHDLQDSLRRSASA